MWISFNLGGLLSRSRLHRETSLVPKQRPRHDLRCSQKRLPRQRLRQRSLRPPQRSASVLRSEVFNHVTMDTVSFIICFSRWTDSACAAFNSLRLSLGVSWASDTSAMELFSGNTCCSKQIHFIVLLIWQGECCSSTWQCVQNTCCPSVSFKAWPILVLPILFLMDAAFQQDKKGV